MIKGKRVLITGATGFIGANLVREFLRKGAEIYIFTRTTSNKWRVGNILKEIHEYCVDLLDYERLKRVILDIRPEIIFHTAVYGGYPFQKDVNKIIQTSVMGTINLVNACSKIEFDILINTGTSSEYGLKNSPMSETDLLEPNSNYGVAKASATLFCQAKARSEKLPIVTLRLFSPYGYYEEPTRLIPSVIISCLTGKNPKLLSPKAVRDFVFVEDVMDAYIRVVKAENIDKIRGEIFNISYGEQHSVGEVVNKMIKLTGNKVKPIWGSVSQRPNEPNIWQANITKAKNVLKWEPKYSLDEGLSKTLRWFERNIDLYGKR